MSYQQYFDPKTPRLAKEEEDLGSLDVRDGSVYVYSEKIVLTVNVAIATGRPLLIFGPPGSGKSSLASFVARTMNWNYFERVISSRIQAQDILWKFDALRRLRDAQAGQLSDKTEAYLEPQVIWWAFDPVSATNRGIEPPIPNHIVIARPPGIIRDINHPSVVLLDEIDKAEPDVPNDLLVALGSQYFRISETGCEIRSKLNPLIFITSNNEKSLPKAFLRRCIVLVLEPPDEKRLIEIARNHFPKYFKKNIKLFEEIANIVIKIRKGTNQNSPSTAEYLDAIRACLELKAKPEKSKIWQSIEAAIFEKRIDI